jgi:hypothetical protein
MTIEQVIVELQRRDKNLEVYAEGSHQGDTWGVVVEVYDEPTGPQIPAHVVLRHEN